MYTDYSEENNDTYSSYTNNSGRPDKEKIKRIAFFVGAFVVLLIIILLIAKACSNPGNNNGTGSGTGTETQNVSIAINRESLSLNVGETSTLYADVLLASSARPVVSWYSEDTNVVEISEDGTVKAIGKGETSIIAVYRENNKVYSAKCIVTVTEKVVTLEKISIIQEEINLAVGKSVLLQVSITPNDAKVDELKYSSDNVQIATVDSKGIVTAVSVGTTTVNVSNSDGTIGDKVTIIVTQDGNILINPVSVELIGTSNALTVGGTAKVYAAVLPTNATNTNLRWTSTDESIIKVSQDGTVTGIAAGKATIIVSTNNNLSAWITITVSSNVTNVTGVTINEGGALTLNVGGTKQITSTVAPSNASNKKVSYSSSNNNIVGVDANGLISAVSAGTAIVTVKTNDQGKTATMTVIVNAPVVENPGSSGGSSSGSSGGSSGGSSSGSSGGSSSGSSSSSSCTSQGMVTISTNTGGAVSSISASNAKWVTSNIVFKVDKIDSCIKKMEYATSCTSSGCTYKTITKGTSFNYSTQGSSKITFRGTKSDGSTITKTYYVKLDKSSPSTVVSKSTTSSTKTLSISITDSVSGVKTSSIKYCWTTGTSCVPSVAKVSTSFKLTVPYSANFFCIAVSDNAGNVKKDTKGNSFICTSIM